ncbi:MAG: hypothetical protein A2868_02435 [Candidatus Levybacteria bacterium RIFCSPHIGHO2_01_FULL_40_15b]|nr:MAG: hypothetical protein A2868_02435 [Candidatus Levybacteria bacterium RIFCSPHIGHO2_01_FULL_40_15b]
MKVVMVAVVSANGKLTRGNDPDIYKWTSKEDQNFFFSLISKSKLIVMGSGTYEAVRKQLKTQNKKLRIVLTSSPEKYKNEQIKGQLEFTSETPRQLYDRMIDHSKMLLVGGSKIYSSFMKEGLVDELYLTIEPVVFGNGKNLFSDESFETKLELVSSKKLNKKGTILLKYRVLR